jgi:hypothetical protein
MQVAGAQQVMRHFRASTHDASWRNVAGLLQDFATDTYPMVMLVLWRPFVTSGQFVCEKFTSRFSHKMFSIDPTLLQLVLPPFQEVCSGTTPSPKLN